MDINQAINQAETLKVGEETKDFNLDNNTKAWIYLDKSNTYHILPWEKKNMEGYKANAIESFNNIELLKDYLLIIQSKNSKIKSDGSLNF